MSNEQQSEDTLAINDPRAIDEILEMKTIAVVGLSDEKYRDSYRVSEYMLNQGYDIIPVNPNIAASLGRASFPNLSAVNQSIEVVDVFRRPQFVEAVIDEAIRVGAKAIWLQYGVIDHVAAEKAHKAGLLVVMDRCIKVEHMRLSRRADQAHRQQKTVQVTSDK